VSEVLEILSACPRLILWTPESFVKDPSATVLSYPIQRQTDMQRVSIASSPRCLG